MFDISASNIIEQDEAGDCFKSNEQPDVSLSRNQTDPNLIEDGVVSIGLFHESDDRFRVEYWGYMSGCLWITHDGVRELKQTFFDDREEIPGWVLSTEHTELPDWFPIPEQIPTSVTCDNCGSDVPMTEILTPRVGDTEARYCHDCWSSIQ